MQHSRIKIFVLMQTEIAFSTEIALDQWQFMILNVAFGIHNQVGIAKSVVFLIQLQQIFDRFVILGASSSFIFRYWKTVHTKATEGRAILMVYLENVVLAC